MWSFVIIVIIQLFLCAATQVYQTENSIIQPEDVFITAPYDDPILSWTTKCSNVDEGWFQVIESLLPSTKGIFYDVAAGYGHSFIRLALKVGPTGSAIGIDRNMTKLSILQENVGQFDLWARSLIAQNYNVTDPFGKFHEKNFFQELYSMLSWQCPHLIHFRENGEDFQELQQTYEDLKFIVSLCGPMLYFDFMRIEMFIIFAQELLSLSESSGNTRYEIYMFPLCCRDSDAPFDTLIRYGLFAMSKALLTPNHNRLIEIHGGVAVTSMKGLRQLANQACDFSLSLIEKDPIDDESENITVTSKRGKYIGRVEIDFDMMHYPFGIIKCLFEHQREHHERFVEDDYFYRVDLFDQPRKSLEEKIDTEGDENQVSPMDDPDHSLVMQVNRACFSWINFIVDKLVKELDHGASSTCLSNNVTIDHIGPERLAALSNCFHFSHERLQFLRNMFDRRSNPITPLLFNKTVPVAEETYDTETAVSKSSEKQMIRYQHHPYGRQYHIKQWFQRNPFEFAYQPDICTEPIFCSYGESFQNALQRWQHPPLRRKDALPNDHKSSIHMSCEDAKYLVYEPPSGLHGIGSMLLLVASAMRYAICLDRILILATHEQQSTILKWEPKGCNLNIFECYFEPISSCGSTISLHELQNANLSMSGEGFDEYPLRNERVLFLRGAPEKGICSLCFDEWPISSKFFDGMINTWDEKTGRYSRDVYAEVFTYKTRLPWLSQLTRGFLKPRQWFADTIQEIIMATMVSPIRDDWEGDIAPQFPRTYVSLHIRHGMKFVETVLYKAQKYMMVIEAKFPYVKDIFVSTETQAIITELIQ
jgi:hypothetical protein